MLPRTLMAMQQVGTYVFFGRLLRGLPLLLQGIYLV